MKDFRVELKVCEGCGALWLRAAGQGAYCCGCAHWLSQFPLPTLTRHAAGTNRRRIQIGQTGNSNRRSGLALVKKNVQRVEDLHVMREATTGRVIAMLPRVWAVAETVAALPRADADLQVGAHRARIRAEAQPAPELAFYRKYTEGLLRRYLRISMAGGRVPSLVGREVFPGKVTHRSVQNSEDATVFCVDVERCLLRLQPMERVLLKRIAVQQYSKAEAAAVLGLSVRGCKQRYDEALDRLTGILLKARLLDPLKTCQEGEEVMVGVSHIDGIA